MLSVAKIDRYDMINNPMDSTASAVIWFSGCSFHCKECQNEALWDRNKGYNMSYNDIFDFIHTESKRLNVKSVVFLGGEPLQQPKDELLLLSRLLKENGYKIWVYTGYELEYVQNNIPEILDYAYMIKCGQYIDELRQDGFPASKNQRIYKIESDAFTDVTNEMRNGGI